MPLHPKLVTALTAKDRDPKTKLANEPVTTLTIPGSGTFDVFIKDWGTLDDAPVFDGTGVRSVIDTLVQYRGADHSFSEYGRVFFDFLNGDYGLRQIRDLSITGISSPGSTGQNTEYYGLLHIQKHCDRSQANKQKRASSSSQSGQQSSTPPPPVTPTGPPPGEVAAAIKGLRGMGFTATEAQEMASNAAGNTADEIIANALKAHGQAKKGGRTESLVFEQEAATGTMGGDRPGADTGTTGAKGWEDVKDPAGGDMPPAAFPEGDLKDGVWYHVPTHRDFPVNDTQWSASPDDAPILALGHNLTRVLNADNKAATWYDENPPPMRPKEPAMYPAYARAMRKYLKIMAAEAIENWNWILFWHGYLYTNGNPINFAAILELGNSDLEKLGRSIPDNHPIAIMDARNNRELVKTTWGELKTSTRASRSAFTKERNVAQLKKILQTTGRDLLSGYPRLVVRDYTAESLRRALFNALCETTLLLESLTYNQMLTATARYWRTRLRTVRAVHTSPPALVMMQDGTVDLAFNFESHPSTEGKPHRGYVKFVPEKGKVNWLEKLKGVLGKAAQNIQRFFGKKVPPQVLKGSDLRRMLVEVSCDCKDFKYRMSWANVKAGVTTPAGRTDNGKAPIFTNPAARPGFCKHILATVRYLTDDAELTISKDLSRQQQETLARDRERFMREAEEQYQKMEVPEAPEAEIEPEKEPGEEEIRKLPPPPKPVTPAEPSSPAAPQAPPPPSYQSTQ
jgi:hypothetical protein